MLTRCFCRIVLACSLLVLTASLSHSAFANAQARAGLRYAPVGGQFTSDFGWRVDPINQKQRFHSGIDIAATEGTPIYAPQAGQVVYAAEASGYGNTVVLRHQPNLFTMYAHSSRLLVRVNDWVQAGQPIALVGATGRVTGPHLHFEVHFNNQYLDPKTYLLDIQQAYLAGRLPMFVPAPQTNSPASGALASTGADKPKRRLFSREQNKKELAPAAAVSTEVPLPGAMGGAEHADIELIEGTERSWLVVD